MNNKVLTRKEKARITKEKLFNTATKLINTKGYDNTTVDEICMEAGVSKGTFYVHYKSKEDIIRESYYSNMGEYIEKSYDNYVNTTPKANVVERIIAFLMFEIKYTNYVGYELTCLAYAMNLSSCIPGPCKHFENRTFTKILKKLINDAYEEKRIKNNLEIDEVFLYLETSVRGMMSSWCFSNGNFEIEEIGELYIRKVAEGLFNI